jgi:phosphotriesterase-related protein
MSQIMTVRGPVDSGELGFTLMHEHLMADAQEMYERRKRQGLMPDPPPVERDDLVTMANLGYLSHCTALSRHNLDLQDVALMASEVGLFKDAGGSAILECSAPGIVRHPVEVRRISEQTGVHVIMSTGLYTEETWPQHFHSMSTDDYLRFMVDEHEHGIEGTGIKPGNIKIALEEKNDALERVARAAVRAGNVTGLALHIHRGLFLSVKDMRWLADALLDEGADPTRVVFCHAEDYFAGEARVDDLITDPACWQQKLFNLRELESFLDAGFNICVDCFGHTWDVEAAGIIDQPDWLLTAAVYALLREGHAEQIVMGHDVFMRINTRAYGGEGFTRISEFVLPTLRRIGVSEDEIRLMMFENPARILATP